MCSSPTHSPPGCRTSTAAGETSPPWRVTSTLVRNSGSFWPKTDRDHRPATGAHREPKPTCSGRPPLFYVHAIVPHHPWQFLPDGRSYPFIVATTRRVSAAAGKTTNSWSHSLCKVICSRSGTPITRRSDHRRPRGCRDLRRSDAGGHGRPRHRHPPRCRASADHHRTPSVRSPLSPSSSSRRGWRAVWSTIVGRSPSTSSRRSPM